MKRSKTVSANFAFESAFLKNSSPVVLALGQWGWVVAAIFIIAVDSYWSYTN